MQLITSDNPVTPDNPATSDNGSGTVTSDSGSPQTAAAVVTSLCQDSVLSVVSQPSEV